MDWDPDACLSAHTIVSYADGALAGDEKAQVERHLDDCRLCAGALEGVARLESRQEYLNSAGAVLTRVRLRAATDAPAVRSRSRVWSASPFLALAATVVILAGMTAYLTRPAGADALFDQQFEPYPSTQPVVRGAATDAASNALSLYESRDYRGALVAFETALEKQPDHAATRFYTGICQLAVGRSSDAIANLEAARKLGAGEFEEPAEWYLALAYLRSHNVREARSRLQGIAAVGGFYAERARALLPALERL